MKRRLRILGVVACGMTLAALFAVVIWQQTCIGRLRAEAEVLRGQVARAPSFREQRSKTGSPQLEPNARGAAEPQPDPNQTLPQGQILELLRLRGQVGVLKEQLAEAIESSLKDGASRPPVKTEESNKPTKPTQEFVEDAERAATIAEGRLADANQALGVVATALKVPESVAQIEGTHIIEALKDPSMAPYQVYLRFKFVCWVLGNNAFVERAVADGARGALQANSADKPSS